MTKVTGIVCDNYKVDKYKKDLTAKGFTDFTVEKFAPDLSIIKVTVEEDQVRDIQKICQLAEIFFKQSN